VLVLERILNTHINGIASSVQCNKNADSLRCAARQRMDSD